MRLLRVFSAHLGLITLVVILIFTVIAFVLNGVTRHGESLSVPDIRGMQIDKAIQVLEEKKLKLVVTDSLFFEDKAPLSILEQNPEPEAKVKEGRTVYITINSSNAPLITVPDLTDVSLRQAQAMLQSAGLKSGQLIYKPDIAQNIVLDQLYGGRSVKGVRIPKGSIVDLVVGNGLGDSASILLPDLTGLTLRGANTILGSSALTIGAVVYQGKIIDSTSAIIFKQDPAYEEGLTVKPGVTIDVYLKQE